MPDILLRKLSQKTVGGLDDLAKQKSKSREAYAKSVLASHVASVEFTGERMEWEALIKNHELVLSEALKVIKEQQKIIECFLQDYGEVS